MGTLAGSSGLVTISFPLIAPLNTTSTTSMKSCEFLKLPMNFVWSGVLIYNIHQSLEIYGLNCIYLQSTLMCWPLKKKMVAGIRVMSKYLVYTGTASTSTVKMSAIFDTFTWFLAS